MKRRSFWKNGLDQVYFFGRNAYLLMRKLLLKNTRIRKKITILRMNGTSPKKQKKCRNIQVNRIKECWCDCWIRIISWLSNIYFLRPRVAKDPCMICSTVFRVLNHYIYINKSITFFKGMFFWYSSLAGLASFYLSLPCWKKLLVIVLLAFCFSH